MLNKKIKIAISFAIVVVLLIWLTITGFDDNLQFYVSIKDVKAMGSEAYSKGLRVKGYLVPGSLVKQANSLEVSFKIIEDAHELDVHYAKELPDTFVDSSEVLVEGKFTPEGYFDAKMLMAKCPSKYESDDDYTSEKTGAGVRPGKDGGIN